MADVGQKETVRLKGTIKKIIFPRVVTTETSWLIAVLAGNTTEVTIKGAMCGIHEKDDIIIEGQWVNDKKYGLQIQVTGWERPIPNTRNQAIDLLSSSVIKGCGPKSAKLIVDTLGDGAIERILRDGAACLRPIRGIGPKSADKIVASLSENFNVQNIIKHLAQYGVTVTMAIKLHQVYKGNAVPVVQANPYELTHLSMVGFDKADEIARNMGVSEDAPSRCQAAVLHVLREYDGHCYAEHDALVRDTLTLLNKRSKNVLGGNVIDSALYYLQKAGKTVTEDGRVYLKTLYEYERMVAARIADLVTTPCPAVSPSRIAQEIVKYQAKHRLILNAQQQEVIYSLFKTNCLILTGGPGTGKSAVIKAVVSIYRQIFPHKMIALCAPTGRASQNLHKTTGYESKTVHRLLNWGVRISEDEGVNPEKARKDELNPLEEDLIEADEWSMADIELASGLLRAIPRGGKVLLVGDPDQLPSVGPGAVLRDMLDSGVIKSVELTEIYRQEKNSLITENAHRVKRGEMIYTVPGRKDFCFIERPDAESTQRTILASVKRLLELGYRPEDILVLSPMKKGIAGVVALDEAIRALVNPPRGDKKELIVGNRAFRVGDVIIQNQRNSVDKGLYNGNMGIVKDIGPDPADPEGSEEGLLCDLWGEEVWLSREDIMDFNFTTGYCITTHKSQGGQAKVVIAPVITNHYMMLTRNILFTAMTRAEEMLILVGQKKAVAIAIKNNTPNLRRTFLAERIRGLVSQRKEGETLLG
ncbi:ATP-dependent RecD-like DNA helicase [Peptococcaceae bacterium CEB3]|nr:ATP-dependent RecD-like DNA helicase [Peptococcaceae bacterium CEB3]